MERLLSVSRELRDKVQENESAVSELLRQCEELREELKAMRQWREVVPSTEENRVQMPNIEFKYIKQLQAENAELRTLLEEHQAAIEMIMSKYRQQVGNFMNTEKQENVLSQDSTADELLHRTDQLYHMAAVISLTVQEDDIAAQRTVEYVTQLEYENKHLRELLQFSSPSLVDSNDRTQPVSVADSTPVNSPSNHPPSASPPHTLHSSSSSSSHSPPSTSPFSASGSTIPPFPNRFTHTTSQKDQAQRGLPQDDIWKRFSRSGDDTHGVDKETVIGNSYVATPMNSGQNTPMVEPEGMILASEPLLEMARDRLADTVT